MMLHQEITKSKSAADAAGLLSVPDNTAYFAKKAASYLARHDCIITLGCKDVDFFSACGLHSIGVSKPFTELYLLDNITPNAIYARDCLHHMDDETESSILSWAEEVLVPPGYLFVETRILDDTLFLPRERISLYEHMVNGHYYRRIDPDLFQDKLAGRFEILSSRATSVCWRLIARRA